MAEVVKEISFEEALARLEILVRELEDGQLHLEKALELFAEGIELSRICNKHLESAEQRISILTTNNKGTINLKEIDSFPAGGGR